MEYTPAREPLARLGVKPRRVKGEAAASHDQSPTGLNWDVYKSGNSHNYGCNLYGQDSVGVWEISTAAEHSPVVREVWGSNPVLGELQNATSPCSCVSLRPPPWPTQPRQKWVPGKIVQVCLTQCAPLAAIRVYAPQGVGNVLV